MVKNGFHVVSMDDTRDDFAPILWEGRSKDTQSLEQIWMPGVHADIGGGYERSFLSTISLLAMIDKLAHCCPDLSFDEGYVRSLFQLLIDEEIVVNDEWSGYWAGEWQRIVGERVRRVVDNADHFHRQHPITSLILDKKVAFKKKKKWPYKPLYKMEKEDALPEAIFGPKSAYEQHAAKILHSKA